MRVRIFFVLVSGVAASLVAATHPVSISGFSFTPSQLTIDAGDTVQWTNSDDASHTSTSDTGVWSSGTLAHNQSFSFTFQNAGTFAYHCGFHPSMTASITVNAAPKAATTTTLESSANPSLFGQNATLTATVTESSNLDPTGTVTFTSDAAPLCSNVTLNGGTASCSTAPLSAGSHSITATYSGDASFEGSTSAPLVQVVDLAPPATLAAFAPDTGQVVLSWSAVSGATSYEVYRSTLVPTFAPRLTADTNGAVDTQVDPNTTYVYKVRALAGGNMSAFSAPDAATTIVYSDASLAGVAAHAAHITELRAGVDAMRAAAGLPAGTFTDDPLTAGTVIRALHVTELRSALDAARSALGVPTLPYTDADLASGFTIRAAHVTELRARTQ